MSVSEQMPLADVKNHLSEVVDRLQREHGRVIITRHGHAAAVVMSVEDLVLQPDFVTCGERVLDAGRPPLDDHGL